MRFFSFLFFCVLGAGPVLAQTAPIEGFWATQEGDAIIAFEPCEEAYCGRFVWLKDDDEETPSLDERNDDKALRGRPLCGLTFLHDFQKESDSLYTGGWIYSPRHGHNYSAEITMPDPDTLSLRGYVFLPFLGATQTWKRVQNPSFCWALSKR